MADLEPKPFEVEIEGRVLAGEEIGSEGVTKGPAIVLAHGITATRDQVVHGSVALARKGYRQISYDARGHGDSDPAPEGESYTYPELAADLGRVIGDRVPEGRAILGGHSMGAHTVAAYALGDPDRVAGMVVIGPVVMGLPPAETVVADWERLAEGLERGGVDGFIDAYDRDHDPVWRETILRFTRERLAKHRHPEAVAEAMRVIATTQPFESFDELEFLDVPALVVASHDAADPGHPRSVAEAWAAKLPRARLIGEEPGESPLAWQGGRLSREIAAFAAEPAVTKRLG